MNHLCEKKRRWQDRDHPGNRIGYQTWLQFLQKNSNHKAKSYLDFTRSAYYLAFVKFGHYCVGVKCLNVARFTDWLLDNRIKVDLWCSDTNYNRYLVDYLKSEDPLDAIARSIETTMDLAQEASVQSKDCLRYVNVNRILHNVTNGKISPWMLYHSESGIQLLEKLDTGQQRLIFDYINPEQWALKFHRNPDIVKQVQEYLSMAGY